MPKVDSRFVGFGSEVRKLRGELGLTQEQLAERTGLSSIYIGTIENGRRDPSLKTIGALAQGLGVTISSLFGPMTPISRAGRDASALFDQAPAEVQKGLLALLNALVKRGGGTNGMPPRN